jgi:hypothetical protein
VIKVYAVVLVVGIVGLIVVIFGGALAENLGREERDPARRVGRSGRMLVAGLVGFGMAGLSAEFAPLDFSWGVSLALAIVGGVAAAVWARMAPGAEVDG